MLPVCYSPKGGQGCTTVTAALALAQRGSRLIDTAGDLPAVLGLPEPSGPGICDLLADDQPLEVAAIERLATPSPTPLVSAGSTPAAAVPAHRWAELVATLIADRGAWFLDAGTNPAADQLRDAGLVDVHVGMASMRRWDQPAETPKMYWLELTEAGRAAIRARTAE